MATNQLIQRIALVTGATGGLGTAICRRLASDGYLVIGIYRNPVRAHAWTRAMESGGYHIPLFQADVGHFDNMGHTIRTIERDLGDIDILVNNAGIVRDGVLRKMTFDQWQEVINTNLTGVFNSTRHVINGMIDRRYGRIINIGSVNAQRGQVGQTNYSASKAGMHGFTKSLAVEVANKGITVNTISPGYIATDMIRSIREDILKYRILPSIPMNRLGGIEEVAYLVSFLASEQASFITGSNYAINGGQHMY